MRALAGLPPPEIDEDGGFVPGNDGGEGEDPEADIADLQQDPPPPRTPPQARAPNLDYSATGLDSLVEGLRNIRIEDTGEAMKGTFLQEVTDPDDPSRTRQRLGMYVILPGGVHADTVEISRENEKVVFAGLLDGRIGNARSLLGIYLSNPNTVRALQASLDEELRKHQAQGGNNDGTLPAEASIALPPSPGGFGWRTGFVNPNTNQVVEDPLFFNHLASTDPVMMADTMAFFSFLLENKPVASTPARGRRDRRAQVAPPAATAATPPATRRPSRATHHHRMDPDNGGSSGSTTYNRSTRRASTSAPSPRRRQRIDENQSYIEESDEALLNEIPINIGGNNNDVSGSFESAVDSFEELGQRRTVISED